MCVYMSSIYLGPEVVIWEPFWAPIIYGIRHFGSSNVPMVAGQHAQKPFVFPSLVRVLEFGVMSGLFRGYVCV